MSNPAEVFATMLHSATTAHMLHLQTKSLAVHLALDGFYKAMPELADALIEAWQGKNGIVPSYPEGFVAQTDPVQFMQSLSEYLQENREVIGADTEFQNLADGIAELIDTTLYKLVNLS